MLTQVEKHQKEGNQVERGRNQIERIWEIEQRNETKSNWKIVRNRTKGGKICHRSFTLDKSASLEEKQPKGSKLNPNLSSMKNNQKFKIEPKLYCTFKDDTSQTLQHLRRTPAKKTPRKLTKFGKQRIYIIHLLKQRPKEIKVTQANTVKFAFLIT